MHLNISAAKWRPFCPDVLRKNVPAFVFLVTFSKLIELLFIFITIYGVVCVRLAHFSIGDWEDKAIAHHQIGSIHISHCYHIFRGCVSDIFVTSYSVTYCIYVPGKPGICFIIIVQIMMSANDRICFRLQVVLVFLYSTPSHYHHGANLSGDIELIKCLSDIFCRVCE